jgi:VWFA-related protein
LGKAIAVSRSFHLILALFLFFPVLAWAQQAAEPKEPVLMQRPAPKPANSATAEGRIKLDVVVTDAAGKPVSGLEAKDFTLLDNNQPQKTVSFHASGVTIARHDQPVEVILLLDAVNIDFRDISFEREEIGKFLQENGGHLAQPVSIFLLTDAGVRSQRQPFTDGNALAAQLNQLKSTVSSSGLSSTGNGAVGPVERFELSLREMGNIAGYEEKSPGRKLLIWIGHGWPLLDNMGSQMTPKEQQRIFDSIVEISTMLREARMALYSVSSRANDPSTLDFSASSASVYRSYLKAVKSARQASSANLGLKVLAIQSGGRVLGPDNGLRAQIDSCVQDAGAFYTLTFDPARTQLADEYHDLKVLIDKPELTARTSTGYYNQP